MHQLPEEIAQTAGAILEPGVYLDRNILAAEIVNHLLEESEKEGIPAEYIKRNIVPGRTVRVSYGSDERIVLAKEILPDGRLLIEDQQGEEEILICGDVSLRL